MSWLGIAFGPGRGAAAAVLGLDRCEVVPLRSIEWLDEAGGGDPRPAILIAMERAGIDPGTCKGVGVVCASREQWRASLTRHTQAFPRTFRLFAAETRNVMAGWVRLRGWLGERGLRAALTRVPACDALAAAALARAAMPDALALAGPLGGDSLCGMLLGGGERGALRSTFRIPAPRGLETLLVAVARHLAVDPGDLAALAALNPPSLDNPLLPLLDPARPSRDAVEPSRFRWDSRGPMLPEAVTSFTGAGRPPGGAILHSHRTLAASAVNLAHRALVHAARRGFPSGTLPALVLCGILPRWLAGHPELRATLPFRDVVLSGVGGPGALAAGAALAVTPASDRTLVAHTVATAPPRLPSPACGERLEDQALGVSRFGRAALLDCLRVHLEEGLPAAWFSAAPSLRDGPDPTRCILIPSPAVVSPAALEPGRRHPAPPPIQPLWRGRVVHPLVATEEGSRVGGMLALDGAPLASPRRDPGAAMRRIDGRTSLVAVHPLLDPALHDLLVSIESSPLEGIGMVSLCRRDGRTVATAEEALNAARALGVPRLVLMDRILDLVPARGPFPVEWGSPLG